MRDDSTNGFSSDLAWKAMYEADIHRRYYGEICNRLRKQNTVMVVTAWAVSLVASVVALVDAIPIAASVAGIFIAAAITTLRDVLDIPERISESRYILMGANREYDDMRLLWETDGTHRPLAERESFRNVSRLHDSARESLDDDVLDRAEDASKRYFGKLTDRTRKEIANGS